MKQQLPFLHNTSSHQSTTLQTVGRWMMSQYPHGFPKREFIFSRIILSDLTRARTTYEDMIRQFCRLFNCRAARDCVGMFRDHVFIIGRKNSVNAFVYYLRMTIIEIEGKVKIEEMPSNDHGSTAKMKFRKLLVQKAVEQIQTIIQLKEDFYFDKYATMRHVRENEVLDRTFFTEFIRENRLTHLKQYKDA